MRVLRILRINYITHQSPSKISEAFNNYFSTIAETLKIESRKANSNPQSEKSSHRKYLKNSTVETISILPTNKTELHKLIKSLKLKSTSDTNILALKHATENEEFLEILVETVNRSLQEGIFPDLLKTAKVIPIHKSGSKIDIKNYRPISLLSTFSKIYEKIMHERLYRFLETKNCLIDTQFGFRKSRSCEHALLVAQNELLKNISEKKHSMLLL